MRRIRSVLQVGIFLLVAAFGGVVSGAEVVPPNIVYVLADDLGVGDVSCLNPNSVWKTPNLDRLAKEGRIFTDAHSASGVCSPSRYALLTGRYAWRGKLKTGVLNGYDRSLIESNRTTVASFLRSQGYATAMVGKWHLGVDWAKNGAGPLEVDFAKPFAGGPLAHGFESFFGISASLDMPPYVYMENDRAGSIPTERVGDSPAPKLWRAGVISPDLKFEEVHPKFEQRALRFLAERGKAGDGKPFFLYLALASPHTPVMPTPEFAGKSKATPYGDFVLQVDATVGKIMETLERQGLAKNTLLIFTADNGFAPPADLEALKKINHDPSAGWRGYKADLFEGGHRVPFIARWPGQVPANTRCDQTIGQLDLLATCAEILGQKLPADAGEDSFSILALLRGGEAPIERPLVAQSSNGSFTIRRGEWKLLFAPDSGGWASPRPNSAEAKGLPPVQLYNLAADRAEKTNVFKEHPEIVRELTEKMKEILEKGRTTAGPKQEFVDPENWRQVRGFR